MFLTFLYYSVMQTGLIINDQGHQISLSHHIPNAERLNHIISPFLTELSRKSGKERQSWNVNISVDMCYIYVLYWRSVPQLASTEQYLADHKGGYHLQSCRACKISGHYHWEPITPLAKQQDANTSIQICTTPYTFKLAQTHTHNLISVHHTAK